MLRPPPPTLLVPPLGSDDVTWHPVSWGSSCQRTTSSLRVRPCMRDRDGPLALSAPAARPPAALAPWLASSGRLWATGQLPTVGRPTPRLFLVEGPPPPFRLAVCVCMCVCACVYVCVALLACLRACALAPNPRLARIARSPVRPRMTSYRLQSLPSDPVAGPRRPANSRLACSSLSVPRGLTRRMPHSLVGSMYAQVLPLSPPGPDPLPGMTKRTGKLRQPGRQATARRSPNMRRFLFSPRQPYFASALLLASLWAGNIIPHIYRALTGRTTFTYDVSLWASDADHISGSSFFDLSTALPGGPAWCPSHLGDPMRHREAVALPRGHTHSAHQPPAQRPPGHVDSAGNLARQGRRRAGRVGRPSAECQNESVSAGAGGAQPRLSKTCRLPSGVTVMSVPLVWGPAGVRAFFPARFNRSCRLPAAF